jgi:DNA-binding SARP family transcriptional activator
MYARLRIELFGGLCVQQGDRGITRFRTQKTASLLAYLAYHLQQAHPREVLAELLWQEHTPKSGRLNLNTALHSLRKQLEPPGVPSGAVILSDRFAVQLNPDAVTVDVAEFEEHLQLEKQTHSQPERT